MNHKFSKNNKYYTIALYTIAVITISTLIIKIIINWNGTSSLLSNIFSILNPFIVGLFIAYFLNPLSTLIDEKCLNLFFKSKHHNLRKIISILLSYIIVIGLIITALFYIIPQIADSLTQISTFINSAQSGYNQLMDQLIKFESKHNSPDLSVINKTLQEMPEKIVKFLTEALPSILPTIYSTSMSVISGVVNVLLSIMVSIYMLIDKHQLLNNCKRIIYAIFGAERGDWIATTANECNRIFANFIIGKLIDSIIIGLLCFLCMKILHLPYALMISAIVGVTNMIPYFGPFIGAIPGIFLLLMVDWKAAFIFLILIIVLQQFDGLFLGPKILGNSTGLRPIWIIFAITIGGSFAGVIGMFLGVPTVAVIAYLLNRYLTKRLEKQKIIFATDEKTGAIHRIEKNEKKGNEKEQQNQ
ncbi:MAG: AI-2E family transporter [Lachnospiraceae bacterium]|nr:AI-2E family transporter [Lachnospiraceae bacterium]